MMLVGLAAIGSAAYRRSRKDRLATDVYITSSALFDTPKVAGSAFFRSLLLGAQLSTLDRFDLLAKRSIRDD